MRCLNKKTFCNECCNYFIGVTHEKDRIKCRERCNAIINGEANVYVVSYGLNRKDKNKDGAPANALPGAEAQNIPKP